jgi:hypothetical protein
MRFAVVSILEFSYIEPREQSVEPKEIVVDSVQKTNHVVPPKQAANKFWFGGCGE